ncbi:endocytic adaptor protein [Gonapodya prolifera JEL478]|uniref:Endocytic adaptor protein n=1 Tax=Gonapodya prolifera (strain JEL478) TaxID=1344416 RepID=A0A139AFG1_GONPJ|nr:endocytic adaptor protein [Gonapodya prolifera JEL478]|eukprot:KXS15498.1 endocytic adaptor protein [Gonapodya prolifera JEL478]
MSYGSREADNALSQNIRKAMSADESAPKQKHVRACIIYTWDFKTGASFWLGLKGLPNLGIDDIVTWKAVVTIHKVIRGGHPNVLKEAIQQMSFIEALSRTGARGYGYGTLIRAYVSFLLAKLDYHRLHPDFNATFDYKEYISLRRIDDPNEGYETIDDMLKLLERVDDLQRQIFAAFRPGSNNECRIAALIPLVEESYSVYTFAKSMLTAMHQRVGAVEVLAPLREKFNAAHGHLYNYYFEASNLKYITSIISVPKLPFDPPQFYEIDAADLPQRRRKEPEPEPEPPKPRDERLVDLFEETSNNIQDPWIAQTAALQEQQRQQQLAWEQEQARLAQEQQRMQMMAAEQERQWREAQNQQAAHQAASRAFQLDQELALLRDQTSRDAMTINHLTSRASQLESQVAQLSLARQETESRESYARSLEEQLAQMRQKYEALAKLYASLRKEHLNLLQVVKEMRETEKKAVEEAKRDAEKAKAEARAASTIVEEANRAKYLAQSDLNRLQQTHDSEVAILRNQLEQTQRQLGDVAASKGAEVAGVVERYEREKSELERALVERARDLDAWRRRVEVAEGEAAALKRQREEEGAALTMGMDQTMNALVELQKASKENEQSLVGQLDKLQVEHADRMNRILDSILDSCCRKVDEAVEELESQATSGNTTATAEYTLTVLDKVTQASADFGESYVKLLQGVGEQTDVIANADDFAHELAQLLHNAKGITRLAEDSALESILSTSRGVAGSAKSFFEGVKSRILDTISAGDRPNAVTSAQTRFSNTIPAFTYAVEALVPKEVSKVTEGDGDIADTVESELLNAAKAIEEAAARISRLMGEPIDGATATDKQVNASILEATMAITGAIANLIRAATASQAEIVAHGRGVSTKTAFYKKNNRWTEGLVSAAKAVAFATNLLVDAADGVVKGTRKMEELVVAATEVSAATTQLVAASRVKGVANSKSQDKLEAAAVAVREATKLLVKAARDAAKRSAEERAVAEVSNMTANQIRIADMEQQVKILELERDLTTARQKLAEMRRKAYHSDEPSAENGTA